MSVEEEATALTELTELTELTVVQTLWPLEDAAVVAVRVGGGRLAEAD